MKGQNSRIGTIFDQAYALVIGVGTDLPDTLSDAIGLASILQDPARCAYPSQQVHLLIAAHARREHILNALDNLAQTTTAQSTVIVYFSGHGYQVTSSVGTGYYLLPHDYDLNHLAQTAISGTEFTARLQAIPARKLLVLLDCCHAGGIDIPKVPGLQLTKSPVPPEALTLLAEGRGRAIIASSREDEQSFAGRPYSAFTLALIEALSGVGVAKQDGYVRVADLALHAREVVPRRTQGRQHPILHFEQANNFVLAYYAGGDTRPKGLPFTETPVIEPVPGAWSSGTPTQSAVSQAPSVQGVASTPSSSYQITINGNVSGQIAIGSGNTQIQDFQSIPVDVSDKAIVTAHTIPGISPTLYQNLRSALSGSSHFASDAVLRDLFVDTRIAPWRDLIPDSTPNRSARVNGLIHTLYDKANTNGDNALVLFLSVLADYTHPADALHTTLTTLADAYNHAIIERNTE